MHVDMILCCHTEGVLHVLIKQLNNFTVFGVALNLLYHLQIPVHLPVFTLYVHLIVHCMYRKLMQAYIHPGTPTVYSALDSFDLYTSTLP